MTVHSHKSKDTTGTAVTRRVLSVVMPAYNEEATIRSVVEDHLVVLASLPHEFDDWELIVLDDASRDRTAELLENLARREPRLRILKHEVNRGLFQAFDSAHRAARGTYVFSTGSDGQWPASNLITMLDVMRVTGGDLVVGIRPNRHEVYSLWRRFISRCYQLLPQLLFNVPVHDPGSIKLGRRELFQCDLLSHSPFVEAERLIHAVHNGYRVEFTPIVFLPRSAGKARGAKLSYIVDSFRDLLRCFWVYRIGSFRKRGSA